LKRHQNERHDALKKEKKGKYIPIPLSGSVDNRKKNLNYKGGTRGTKKDIKEKSEATRDEAH